ncbi:MAG TPA: SGNH/GDSL hydrolase family protein [Phycisphaerae bacterium]|nr:SGNH/GDSL hydrolase family protein [Phycisphaerae bacterium]HNU43991.1 SGNH/GDSL hydrolase family protein [Phycisphaerae bacterium]
MTGRWQPAVTPRGRTSGAGSAPRPRLGHRPRGRASLVLACTLAAGVGSGGISLLGCYAPPQQPPASSEITAVRVSILGVEHLTPPATGYERVYKPAAIAPDGSAGFFLSVAVRDQQALQLRLKVVPAQTSSALVAVAAPGTAGERALGGLPQAFNANTTALLAAGRGFWWLDEGPGPPDDLGWRLGVVLPGALLGEHGRLEVFAADGADGAPLGGDRIDLVRDFFYLAVIGDSIQWGNGLREEDKIWARVARVIAEETGRYVVTQVHAQAGAEILPSESDTPCFWNCYGEVPRVTTSVTLQAQLIERPELMDLVLMDGCINDVGVETIIDPLVPLEELTALTEQSCGPDMSTLLRQVRTLAPQAPLVVTGYFPIVGRQSDVFGVRRWADSKDITLGEETETLLQTLVDHSMLFWETAHAGLTQAVAEVNTESAAGPMAAFADPGFTEEHAVFTPDRWLWSLTADGDLAQLFELDLDLFPEDPLFAFRAARCFDDNAVLGLVGCLYASVGHPNPRGAQAYADAVIAQLRVLGVLPPA